MKKSSRMSIVHPHAAGVDIGAEFHVVAVPPDADAEPVRTFQSFTGDLHGVSLDIENYCTLRLFFDLSTLGRLSRRNLPEAGILLLFQI